MSTMSTRAAAGSKAISASAASAGKSNSSLVVCPAVVLLQPSSSPDQDGDSTDSLVHFFPDHAAAAKQAKRLQGLLLALCGISTALTGQQVAVVKMGAASQLDIKAAYVHFQGCVLVFCLPGALSDGAARAIATDMAALLQCVLGSLEDWQMKATSETPTRSSSIRTVSEGVEAPGSPSNDVDVIFVSEDLPQSQLRAPLAKKVDFLLDTSFRQLFGSDWRAAALIPMFPLGVPATLQSETARLRGSEALSLLEAASAPPSERLVRASQFEPAKAGCLFHRGALVTSHMTPEETKEVWRVCWALSLFRRTAAHPPLILLQDLHMPLPASPGRAQAGGRPQAGARRKLAMVIVGLGADLLCLLMTPLGLACAADLEGAYELDAAAATLHQLQNSGDISDDCMAPGQTNALLLEVEDPAAALLNQAKSKAHTQLDKPKKLPRAAKSRAAHGSSPVAATASAAATTPQHFQLVYDEALGHLICQQPAEGNANLLADFFSTVAFLRATVSTCAPAQPGPTNPSVPSSSATDEVASAARGRAGAPVTPMTPFTPFTPFSPTSGRDTAPGRHKGGDASQPSPPSSQGSPFHCLAGVHEACLRLHSAPARSGAHSQQGQQRAVDWWVTARVGPAGQQRYLCHEARMASAAVEQALQNPLGAMM